MTAFAALSIFAGLGLLLIVGALRADMRESRKRRNDLIEEIRAETERVKQFNIWRKS